MTLMERLKEIPAERIVRVGADTSWICIDTAEHVRDHWAPHFSEVFAKDYKRMLEHYIETFDLKLNNPIMIHGMKGANRVLVSAQKPQLATWQEYVQVYLARKTAEIAEKKRTLEHLDRMIRRTTERVKNFRPFAERDVVKEYESVEAPGEYCLIVKSCGTRDTGWFWDKGEFDEWLRTGKKPVITQEDV